MSQLRVVALMHSLSLTGAPRILLHSLSALGADLSIRSVALEGGPLMSRAKAIGPLTLIASAPPGRSPAQLAARASVRLRSILLAARLRAWQPNLVYVNTVAALPLLERLRLPESSGRLLHVHELESSFGELSPRCRELLRAWPDRWVADSESVRKSLTLSERVQADSVEVVYEFVPDAALQRARPRPVGSGSPLVVGAAGVPNWRKAPLLWLQVAAELLTYMPPGSVRMVWLGVPDDEAGRSFRVMAQRLGLAGKVDLLPPTPDPWPVFQTFDLFTVTSIEEPFSMVMAENMALGTPGACFAGCGGTPEVIGDTGLVIPSFSPAAMAQAIAELAGNPYRMREMGTAAKDRVRERFTASVQVPRLRREMEAAVEAGRSRRR